MFAFKFVVLSSESYLTHHISHIYNFSYAWHIGLKLHTQLDKYCILYYVWKKLRVTILKISMISYTVLFSKTPVIANSGVIGFVLYDIFLDANSNKCQTWCNVPDCIFLYTDKTCLFNLVIHSYIRNAMRVNFTWTVRKLWWSHQEKSMLTWWYLLYHHIGYLLMLNLIVSWGMHHARLSWHSVPLWVLCVWNSVLWFLKRQLNQQRIWWVYGTVKVGHSMFHLLWNVTQNTAMMISNHLPSKPMSCNVCFNLYNNFHSAIPQLCSKSVSVW